MKSIEITITPQGETRIETRGYQGSDCQHGTRALETALGTRTTETLTAEFYQSQSHRLEHDA